MQVYAAMEYKIRKALADAKMVFPLLEKNKTTDKTTSAPGFPVRRPYHLRIQIIRMPDGTDYITNIDPTPQLLVQFGDYWCRYYVADTYHGKALKAEIKKSHGIIRGKIKKN